MFYRVTAEVSKNNKERQQNQVVYSSVKENGNFLLLQGKCGKFDFTVNVSFEQFPSEKARDKAYKVWVETFLKAVFRNGRKTGLEDE